MTKEILKLSALLLGLDDVSDYLKDSENQTPSADTLEKLDDLLLFTNYILREITKEYYPLIAKEKVVSSDNCEIAYSSLSKNAIAIKNILNESNLPVTFNLYPNFIKVGVPNAQYTLTYNYTPDRIESINEPLTLPFGLDYFVVSYGVASEYASSRLLFSEADMWDTKFRNSLQHIKSRHGERKFFSRRLK